jgi:predicted nuclease of predicted toxin-antitoxin system
VRFLADMGVSRGVVEWLRSAGHDAMHLRDEGLHRLPNGDIFQKGFIEHRVVLTFDLDFGEIVAASESRLVSVVLFRLHNTRTGHVIERLQAVLEQSSTELRSGAIIVVEEGRHRVRRLPIGS